MPQLLKEPVLLYEMPGHPRSRAVCRAMETGLKKIGVNARRVSSAMYRQPLAKVAVFYGLAGNLKKAFKDYTANPELTLVFVDLGYTNRKDAGRFVGMHKLSVNGRHPTSYFQRREHDDSRLRALGLDIKPWTQPNPRGHILLAGMAPKASAAEHYAPTAWEAATIAGLKKHTARRIVYRPKPNWTGARPIPGCDFSKPGERTLEQDLFGAHCIVSHHSNANVEALAMGVPSFTREGIASVLSGTDFAKIESPIRPEGREKFFRDMAYTQWTCAEMATGAPWIHLREEGLV